MPPSMAKQPMQNDAMTSPVWMSPWAMMSTPVLPAKRLALDLRGFFFMTSLSASSIPRESAGRLSVTRLIQRIMSGERNVFPHMTVAMNRHSTSAMFADSRNWIAFLMLEKIFLPSSTAPMMVAKLSSASTRSAAPLLTSVPVMPMPMPMSARLMDGASLTPSPVMATTLPLP